MPSMKHLPHTLSGGSRIPLLVQYIYPDSPSEWLPLSVDYNIPRDRNVQAREGNCDWLTAADVLVCVCTGERYQPVVACRGG